MYDTILTVAEELFMTQGYQATSTRQISEQIGVTQPTLYYYFKKKEELYYHVMVRLSADVKENLEQIAQKTALTLAERMEQMVFFLQEKHPYNLMIMMHDIKHVLPKEMEAKLFDLWVSSYKAPFVDLLANQTDRLRPGMDAHWAVSQLFILLSPQFERTGTMVGLTKSIHLFLYGLLQEE